MEKKKEVFLPHSTVKHFTQYNVLNFMIMFHETSSSEDKNENEKVDVLNHLRGSLKLRLPFIILTSNIILYDNSY